MDPDATLNELIAALLAGDPETAEQRAGDLAEWIARGGFIPLRLRLLQ